jgi:hypothetical protein
MDLGRIAGIAVIAVIGRPKPATETHLGLRLRSWILLPMSAMTAMSAVTAIL